MPGVFVSCEGGFHLFGEVLCVVQLFSWRIVFCEEVLLLWLGAGGICSLSGPKVYIVVGRRWNLFFVRSKGVYCVGG